jgi:PAS domain-containing protein
MPPGRIKQGEQAIQTEIVRVRPDGSSVPCIVSAYPLHTPDNRLIGIMESYRDITEKKKLEAHAREAEERYQAIIELGNEAGEAVVILQNVEGRRECKPI